MKTRLEELDELIAKNELHGWIEEACAAENPNDAEGYKLDLQVWKQKLEQLIKLHIEKHDLMVC